MALGESAIGCCPTLPHGVIVLVCRSRIAIMPRLVIADTTPSRLLAYDASYTHEVDTHEASLSGTRMELAPHALACASSSWPGTVPLPSIPTRLNPRST